MLQECYASELVPTMFFRAAPSRVERTKAHTESGRNAHAGCVACFASQSLLAALRGREASALQRRRTNPCAAIAEYSEG